VSKLLARDPHCPRRRPGHPAVRISSPPDIRDRSGKRDETRATAALDLNLTVAIYGVAGRKRSPVATMLSNLLRTADWSRYVH
jgi:hypothetical protein